MDREDEVAFDFSSDLEFKMAENLSRRFLFYPISMTLVGVSWFILASEAFLCLIFGSKSTKMELHIPQSYGVSWVFCSLWIQVGITWDGGDDVGL